MNSEFIASKIQFMQMSTMEFLYAMRDVADISTIISICNTNKHMVDSRFIKLLRDMKGRLSRFTLQELNCFFASNNISYAFYDYSIDRPQIKSIPELIQSFKEESEYVMFPYLFASFLYDNPGFDRDFQKEKSSDINYVIEYLNQSYIRDSDSRNQVVEFMKNPEETKQRYCYLFRQFYEKAYKPIETIILDYLKSGIEKYKAYLQDNPEAFYRNFIPYDMQEKAQQYIIHVSYFLQFSFAVKELNNNIESIWMALGYNIDKQNTVDQAGSREQMYQLFKVLSDDTRLKIVELISRNPMYNQELAEKLGVTTAAITYHTNSLKELGIISIDRKDHRLYFSLNKKALNDHLMSIKMYLIQE